ncbi:MAG: nitric oxide reductase activation protein NorD [Planctomycetota bacterium]
MTPTTDTSNPPQKQGDALMKQMGFDLSSVTWGYQEIFRRAIGELAQAGLLGENNEEVTRAFFDMLQRSDKSGFDMVLKSYLDALKGGHRWIMRLPRLFERWTRMGLDLSQERYYLGARFFEYAGNGQLGDSPQELELALDLIAWLNSDLPELVPSFLEGFHYLRQNLDAEGIRDYVGHALTLHPRNRDSAKKFLAGELETSQVYVEKLSRQSNLAERQDALERLTRALCGYEISVNDLGELDSDDLQERGSRFIVCQHAMYLPARLDIFGKATQNRLAYRTLVTLGCTSLNAAGFPLLHGENGITTCRELFANAEYPTASTALFYLVEAVRTVRSARRTYPGVDPVLSDIISLEFEQRPPHNFIDRVMAHLFRAEHNSTDEINRVIQWVRTTAGHCSSARETTNLVKSSINTLGSDTIKRCGAARPRALTFLPDPLFPLTISEPPRDSLKADMHDMKEQPPEEDDNADESSEAEEAETEQTGDESTEQEQTDDGESGGAGFWYDEWNQAVNDYQRNWCRVTEKSPDTTGTREQLSDPALRYSDKVREIFQRLKPEEVQTQKRLLEGDSIHMDHLIEYIAEGEERRGSDMRFYNKPLTNRRDLAVSILLDISGSTGERAEETDSEDKTHAAKEFGTENGQKSVLQVEKEAAFVMGTGLHTLGDTFSVYGFTGNGRENCTFYNFKDFDETWDEDAIEKLLSAIPGSATRIGAALRHAGWKLSDRGEKTKLLLLITDGKPCDQGYDTESQYAQHDIRKACQENRKHNIHTFCVSTTENTPADMELMFPRGRYLILDDIRKLPRVLSRLYLRLTQ